MQNDAMLIQLGYTPNETLVKQLKAIKENTKNYEKIEKHIMDLHDHLKVHNGYVAMSNSKDHLKIKVEATEPQSIVEANEKIHYFSQKYKVAIEKLPNKETYYILGFEH
ncbi:MAG: hypothetical protein FAF05_04945 [Epsilonproteobacteria bacterium]|nr:hypothetical protein [Campylobacterota bacterium]